MDILHLVDRLEELFNESRSLPLTNKVIVDEERMLELIDQMRLAIPEEIKSSQQILNQKERILAQSNEEARRTIELAKAQSIMLTKSDVIVKKAETMAENIIQKAKQESVTISKEADGYAINTLQHLEVEIGKILIQVRNGLSALQNENASKNKPLTPVVDQISSNHIEPNE